MERQIYTKHGDEKLLTEFKTWEDVLKAGWVLLALTDDRHALMTRRGYLNEFWHEVD